ncbi:MAG: chemotaxis protein CheW [Proteobacteria bacterium]|nr:MAG: chemotaxis protein CheW [Pseudomonadota bacterium]
MKGFGIFDEEDELGSHVPEPSKELPGSDHRQQAEATQHVEPNILIKAGMIDASSLLLFRKGKQRYGVDVQFVKEVHGGLKVRKLPLTSSSFSGVIIVNGAVVAVASDEIIFSKSDILSSTSTISNDETFIIFEVGSDHLAIRADEASQVINVDKVAIRFIDANRQIALSNFSGITQFLGESVLVVDILSLIATIRN